MRILHTADLHIGQMFYNYDRAYEHECFLNWLTGLLAKEQVDVLLISGDIYDISNPSAASIRLFYRFLNSATKACPGIQIIVTAGNHDSASRLESPRPLLESSNIHIVGLISKDETGKVDYDQLMIPLNNKAGKTEAWCLAVPFLRMGDYPIVPKSHHPYADGVTALYREAADFAFEKATKEQVVIAMGHLHTRDAAVSDMDRRERPIMGGVECIPASAFHPDFKYVALGHIHKAQRVGGKEHIRYSGSPLPMSFSEANYRHQVLLFDLDAGHVSDIRSVDIPVVVSLKRVPAGHALLPEVLQELAGLPEWEGKNAVQKPYLEVRVLQDGPQPSLRYQIERVIENKAVRLARIDIQYKKENPGSIAHTGTQKELDQLKPSDIFQKAYQAKYDAEVPEDLMRLFHQVAQESTLSE